jgi:hypothetical protein
MAKAGIARRALPRAKFNVCLRMAFISTSTCPVVYTPKPRADVKTFGKYYDGKLEKKVIRLEKKAFRGLGGWAAVF